MISRETIQGLEARDLEYILGARMRQQREVSEAVLGRAGPRPATTANLCSGPIPRYRQATWLCSTAPVVGGAVSFGPPSRCCAPVLSSIMGARLFLALALVDELQRRLAFQGMKLEWDVIRQDLQSLDQAAGTRGQPVVSAAQPSSRGDWQGTSGSGAARRPA